MNLGADVNRINAALVGATELLSFELQREDEKYQLSIRLGREKGPPITLLCGDVQNIELNPAGNGFEQLLCLRVTDMRADDLGRIKFSLEEMERETLFLHCAEIELIEAI